MTDVNSETVLRVLLTISIGACGGAGMMLLDLPLPWLIGSLGATTLVALLGVNLRVPGRMRSAVILVIGLMIGSSFSPETMSRFNVLLPSVVGVCVYAIVTTAIVGYALHRFAGFNGIDAFCSGAPGGFAQMVLLSGAMGGDERKVSLMHTIRIMVVVIMVPFAYRLYFGTPPSAAAGIGHVANLGFDDAAMLVAMAALGYVVARLLRLPLPILIGPMFASALFHGAGWTDAKAPMELVAVAQVVLGSSIGCRFSGLSLRSIARVMGIGAVATLAMVAIAAGVAAATAAATGMHFDALFMAFAPGGVTEINLVALSLNIDPVFVASMHLARVAFLMIAAPLVVKWTMAPRPGTTPGE